MKFKLGEVASSKAAILLKIKFFIGTFYGCNFYVAFLRKTIFKGRHWDKFSKIGALKITVKMLKKYLWRTSFLVRLQAASPTKNWLLYMNFSNNFFRKINFATFGTAILKSTIFHNHCGGCFFCFYKYLSVRILSLAGSGLQQRRVFCWK